MPEPGSADASVHDDSLGCYGLRLRGIDGASCYMSHVAGTAELTVEQRAGYEGPRPPEELDADSALVHLSDGTGIARVDRARAKVTLYVRYSYDDEAVLHPMLSSAAAIANRWLGRDTFHAGAFVVSGAAWVVIGAKGQGKSTALGYLATRGVQIVSDDLTVEDNGRLHAGPSFVDLRADAAAALGLGRDVGMLGARPRARLDVPAAAPRTQLGGWFILGWGEKLGLRPVAVEEKLRLLYENRAVRRTPVDPASYLRHAALPFWELTRPKDWNQLAPMHDLLLATVG